MDKLIDDIIEFILEDMDCHHEVDRDEDGTHMSVDYSLNDEAKVRDKIMALLKPGVTEEWIEKKAKLMSNIIHIAISSFQGIRGFNMLTEGELKNFIRSLVEDMPAKKSTVTEKFVQEAIDYIAKYPSYKRLEKKFKEAGVEVVEK